MIRQGRKVAFYRPVISYTRDGKDEILSRLMGRFNPSFSYEDAYAYTLSEVRELINDGKESRVYYTILGKC